MSINIPEILKLLDAALKLEKRIEEAVKNEQDKKRRKKMLDAIRRHDLDALRNMLFD